MRDNFELFSYLIKSVYLTEKETNVEQFIGKWGFLNQVLYYFKGEIKDLVDVLSEKKSQTTLFGFRSAQKHKILFQKPKMVKYFKLFKVNNIYNYHL